ncbi:NnrU family protein [Dongia rigui]|uniref:NnrU family protein n=1 Tax=Dongia rigui TaxID=940149 RepID=A0ABU5E313_9PROT|nr:NnrU family protein [Dongia rigui]MDY0873211.1 NnrU family protein [Dongia rigui]
MFASGNIISGLDGWGEFAAALALFFLSHGISASPRLRQMLRHHLGRRCYGALYGTLSLIIFYWLIQSAGRAPYVELWGTAPWQYLVPHIAMPIACLLLACGIGVVNPFSLGGTAGPFSPRAPGIAGVTRHPLLWAVILWAMAHLFPNGDVAHLLLFASLGLYGVVGTLLFDARRRAAWGPSQWLAFSAHTSWLPGWALMTGRWRGDVRQLPWRRLIAAMGLYVGILFSHAIIIGATPRPF